MKKFKLVLAAAGLALASSGANAAIVSVSGKTVDFSFDDSFLSPLFGSYSVSGDTLSFSPTAFSVKPDRKSFMAEISATTPLISISAKSGYALTELDLFEQGDYFRIQKKTDTSFVGVSGQFIVNGSPDSITPTQPLSTAFSVKGLFDGTETLKPTTWAAEGSVYLNSVESATAKIQSILFAGIDSKKDSAFIEQTLMNLSAETSATSVVAPVPVPGAIWLFGSVLFGILVSRRSNIAA